MATQQAPRSPAATCGSLVLLPRKLTILSRSASKARQSSSKLSRLYASSAVPLAAADAMDGLAGLCATWKGVPRTYDHHPRCVTNVIGISLQLCSRGDCCTSPVSSLFLHGAYCCCHVMGFRLESNSCKDTKQQPCKFTSEVKQM